MNKSLWLSLLLAGLARAADLPLAEAPKLGLQTTTTGPISLTFKPDGGATVAVLPKDAKAEVLMSDEAGHQLLRNDFGLVGWAKAGGEGSDDFNPEQLKKREVKYKGQEEDIFSLWYDGALGQAREGIFHEDDEDKLHEGAHPSDSVFDYERILETALKPDGPRFAVLCSSGMSDDYFCLWLPADAIVGADARKAPGIGGQTFYMPGNGFVYAISDSAGSSYTEHHREKWALVDGQFKEVEQPYYYIGRENSVYQGRRGTDDYDIRKKPLTLTDAGGKTVATLQPGDQVTLLLRDNQHKCPKERQINELGLCSEERYLLRTGDGTLGWITVDYNREDAPVIDGLSPMAG